MKKIFSLLVVILTGCSSPHLSVRTIYGSSHTLTSVREDTPDPTKTLVGRSHTLVINWSSPNAPSPTLECVFRFTDEELIHETRKLEGTYGEYCLEIDQSLFRKHGSLLAYKIILVANGKELSRSEHKLWVEPIQITTEDPKSPVTPPKPIF